MVRRRSLPAILDSGGISATQLDAALGARDDGLTD